MKFGFYPIPLGVWESIRKLRKFLICTYRNYCCLSAKVQIKGRPTFFAPTRLN